MRVVRWIAVPVIFLLAIPAVARGQQPARKSRAEQVIKFARVPGITSAIDVAGGSEHTCALLEDGSVQCWGHNCMAQLGFPKDEEEIFSPVTIEGISNAVAITSAWAHTCVLTADKTIQCWGENSTGQLGNGTERQSYRPVTPPSLSRAESVSAGIAHTCAVVGDSVRCWGTDSYGAHETVTYGVRSTLPEPVSGIADAMGVAAGRNHTCTLLASGRVQCWGSNIFGQLGTSMPRISSRPVTVAKVSGASLIASGLFHTCAIVEGGRVKCWGLFLDEGTNDLRDEKYKKTLFRALPIEGITSATSLTAGAVFSCALLTDGSVRCWGQNDDGQLGNGSHESPSAPVKVLGLSSVKAVDAGFGHACAVLANGRVICWGVNKYGQLGRK